MKIKVGDNVKVITGSNKGKIQKIYKRIFAVDRYKIQKRWKCKTETENVSGTEYRNWIR